VSAEIRRAHHGDIDAARNLLSEAGLPVEDLSAEHLAFVAEIDGRFVGTIGLESFGAIGLLRSLVVSADTRAGGLGRRLVAELEASTHEQGTEALWLLTIDADPFFQRLGYVVMDRADAPPVIRKTAEFSGLCPGDAVLMSKAL